MKSSWLIQTNILDIDTTDLIAEITKQDMSVIPYHYDALSPIDINSYKPFCCIGYGSIDFVKSINRNRFLMPGAYCNFHNMECNTYYTYLGTFLLNREYAMMPLGDFYNRFDTLSQIVDNKAIFLRPTSGTKSFDGCVIKPNERHKIQPLIDTAGPETMIVASIEKHIDREFRFVICDHKVITGCQYLPKETSSYTSTSLCLAQQIAKHSWQPDICYTIDIAQVNNKAFLLEINSFSCAALYKSDLSVIVEKISKVAVREWREYV